MPSAVWSHSEQAGLGWATQGVFLRVWPSTQEGEQGYKATGEQVCGKAPQGEDGTGPLRGGKTAVRLACWEGREAGLAEASDHSGPQRASPGCEFVQKAAEGKATPEPWKPACSINSGGEPGCRAEARGPYAELSASPVPSLSQASGQLRGAPCVHPSCRRPPPAPASQRCSGLSDSQLQYTHVRKQKWHQHQLAGGHMSYPPHS